MQWEKARRPSPSALQVGPSVESAKHTDSRMGSMTVCVCVSRLGSVDPSRIFFMLTTDLQKLRLVFRLTEEKHRKRSFSGKNRILRNLQLSVWQSVNHLSRQKKWKMQFTKTVN